MSLKLLSISSVLALSSCSITADIKYNDKYGEKRPLTPASPASADTSPSLFDYFHFAEEERQKTCPIFVLPPYEAPPPAPIEELDKLGPSKKNEKIQVLVRHITELKKHRLKDQSVLVEAYNDYLKKCK